MYLIFWRKAVKCVISSLSSLSAPEPDVSSDSSEMVKAIIQTVQNQDKVLKDLYTHLRSESNTLGEIPFSLSLLI